MVAGLEVVPYDAAKEAKLDDLIADVASGVRVLKHRDGVNLSESQIMDRARNIVQGLITNYGWPKVIALVLALAFGTVGCGDNAPPPECVSPQPGATLTHAFCYFDVTSGPARCEWIGPAPDYQLQLEAGCWSGPVECVEECP
jgi:hypothetical protein